jgi:peptidoglycan glycosyltransferase
MISGGSGLLSWGKYQRKLQREAWRKRLLIKSALIAGCSACLSLIIVLVIFFARPCSLGNVKEEGHPKLESREPGNISPGKLLREDLLMSLRDLNLSSANLTNDFVIEKNGTRTLLKSSIDSALQNYILRLLQGSKTLEAAVVALNPNTGRVLAMVNYEKDEKGDDLCLKAGFPAASIFKIVAAAAALESAGFTPDQTITFQGRKHTLYKRQLEQKKGRYSSKTSFRQAFASSINPVFGKLGVHYLGQEVLSDYAGRFFFNSTIPFDLPVGRSTTYAPDDEFGLAEIASGFNKKTLISPLHGALLVSAVANSGVMMTPWLVERAVSQSGEVLYQSRPTVLTSPISKGTAVDMRVLMRDTVLYGTCRRSFRLLRRKKAFRDVEFGAKTGNINDELDQLKYDWLTAYALPPNGAKAICVAVLGVHGEKLGIRANELGRYIINYYLSS